MRSLAMHYWEVVVKHVTGDGEKCQIILRQEDDGLGRKKKPALPGPDRGCGDIDWAEQPHSKKRVMDDDMPWYDFDVCELTHQMIIFKEGNLG